MMLAGRNTRRTKQGRLLVRRAEALLAATLVVAAFLRQPTAWYRQQRRRESGGTGSVRRRVQDWLLEAIGGTLA